MILAASTSVGPHIFWITSRAAGVAALVLSSASVGAGLMISSRGSAGGGLRGDARALHEALSLATLIAIAVHGAALLGDHFLHPSVFDISVPFTGAYRPLWTGVGIVSGWALAALGLSFYLRGRIGQQRWRTVHRFTALFWALGIVHSIGSGSDAGQPWFLIVLVLSAAPAAVLLIGRLTGRALARSGGAVGARPAPRQPPGADRPDRLEPAAVVDE